MSYQGQQMRMVADVISRLHAINYGGNDSVSESRRWFSGVEADCTAYQNMD